MASLLAREYINVGGQTVRWTGGTSTPVDPRPRSQLQLGVDKPGPGNCGLEDPTILVAVNVATTYSSTNSGTVTNPTIIRDKMFTKKVSLSNVQHILFINCWFKGEAATSVELITATNAGNLGIRFESCLFKPQNPMYRTSAVSGHHVSFKWCEFSYLIDGVAHRNSGGYSGDQGITIMQSWFHDYWYASPDPDAAGGWPDNASHVDIVLQFRGGSNVYIGGNTINGTMTTDTTIGTQVMSFDNPAASTRLGSDAGRMSVDQWDAGSTTWRHIQGNKYYDYKRTARNSDGSGNVIIQPPTLLYSDPNVYLQATSIVMFSPGLGPISNFVAESNWIETGGACVFNFNSSIYPDTYSVSGVVIKNNKLGTPEGWFIRNPQTFLVLCKSTMPITITGNVRVDTGEAWDKRVNG